MFESVEEVQQRFRDARYIANRRISTVVFLAARMGRPVLIEGPAGVGKTELAKTLADVTSRAADPPAVLRGARRGQGALRVEVRQAAALHAAAARAHRRADRRRAVAAGGGLPHRRPGRRVLLLPVPLAAAAAVGDPGRRSGGAAGRRDRQGRAGVRGLPAGGAVGLPGLDPGAGHGQGQAHPARRPDLEQRPRAQRRPQAPLPAPVHRLPGAGRRAGDHPAQGAGGARASGPGRRRRGAEDPRAGAAQAAVGVGVDRLGALARDPQRQGARSRAWSSPP